MLSCCHATSHPWDRWQVEKRWMPEPLRCLIIAENPGDVTSEYFYQPPVDPERDPVRVRNGLLHGLHDAGLLIQPTLEAFRDAGFLLDHAIRCPLPSPVVNQERSKASRYTCKRVSNPLHLVPALKRAPLVWVMGHLASNAVANATPEFPKEHRLISRTPFPGPASPGSRFFISEYFTRHTAREGKDPRICSAFAEFGRKRGLQPASEG
jgi:hypothetical protein